jgi:hypothetical protein
MVEILARRGPALVVLAAILVSGLTACDKTSNGAITLDGDIVDGDQLLDGDMELLEDDFVPYQPIVCPINDCQSRRLTSGAFCFGYDLNVDRDMEVETEALLLDQNENILRTIVECGKDENDCPVEIGRSECEFGCNPDTHTCNEPAARSQLVLTISRNQNLTSVVDGGADATDFEGSVSIFIYTEPRQSGHGPTAPLVAHAIVQDIDLRTANTTSFFTVGINLADSPTGTLAVGTYYLDAVLKINNAAENEPLITGDLLTTDQSIMSAPEEGPCTATVVLDRVYDSSLDAR